MPAIYQINGFPQMRIGMIIIPGLIAGGSLFSTLFSSQSKQEKILRADLMANFNIGPVQCPDGQRPVHGKLHIARPRSFVAGGGDLFRQVSGGINPASLLYVVVRQKHYFEAITDIWISIQHLSYRVDQLNDQLGHEVAWGCFATKDKCP